MEINKGINVRTDTLLQENKLICGQLLISQNKNYFAYFHSDGNLTVYVSSHFIEENQIFSTFTSNKGVFPYYLSLNNDHNLLIYDSKETPIFSSNTYGSGKGICKLIMQNNGNLAILDSNNQIIWETATQRK